MTGFIISLSFLAIGYLAGRWHAKRIATAQYDAQLAEAQRVQPAKPNGGGGGGPLEPL